MGNVTGTTLITTAEGPQPQPLQWTWLQIRVLLYCAASRCECVYEGWINMYDRDRRKEDEEPHKKALNYISAAAVPEVTYSIAYDVVICH